MFEEKSQAGSHRSRHSAPLCRPGVGRLVGTWCMAGPALLGVLSLAFLIGCASGGGTNSGPESPAGRAPASVSPTPEARVEPAGPGAEAGAEIFTQAQSDRGRSTFDAVCSECHTTSEFRGRGFQANWGRRTVYSFYRTVRSTMPDDDPGGLDEQVYLDVVSYILRMNGHRPGPSELSPDSPMRDVRIALPGPER